MRAEGPHCNTSAPKRMNIGLLLKPVGVYLSFWQPTTESGSLRSLPVMLVNDESREVEGTLTLALENARGEQVATRAAKFTIAPLGHSSALQRL